MLSETPKEMSGDTRASWWQAIFDASEDALLVCDRVGRLRECNRRAQKFFNPNQPPEGLNICDAVTPQTTARLQAVLARESSHSETLSSISFIPGGHLRMIVDLVVSRLDAGHWLVAIKDATRRWRME